MSECVAESHSQGGLGALAYGAHVVVDRDRYTLLYVVESVSDV